MSMRTVRYRVRASGLMQRLELDAGKLARPVLRGRGNSNVLLLPDQALETKARFIAQIMNGESGVRRADDIGGQELSYAEVKAIASGNPAVLTLAEADAELQRLAILKKGHVDQQYLARRNVRDLPGEIERFTERMAGLNADLATVKAHANDPVTIGSYPVADPVASLGQILDTLPAVMQTRRIPLGIYKGLRFGMVLHPTYRPEVYLEGKITRQDMLSRDHQGPRAVLNALERLADGYKREAARVQEDLEIANFQLRDYQARLGQPFPHDAYLSELAALRDQLRVGLSGEPKEGEPTAMEIAQKIKALRAGNVVEAGAERSAKRISAEEPVTARIMRKAAVQTDEDDEEVGNAGFQDRVRDRKMANGRG